MIKIENLEQRGVNHAVRAMRNPLDSWAKSDSYPCNSSFILGDNDKRLMKALIASGAEHRTFMRQIQVWCDVTATMNWWRQMDRYTVGKTQVSCSTMHKLGSRMLTMDDFAFNQKSMYLLQATIKDLNGLIMDWQEDKDKETWEAIINTLPRHINKDEP